MRNASLVLGIIAGLWGMIYGFFNYGYTELAANVDWLDQVENVGRTRAVSLGAPILAIAGGAMVHSQAMVSTILLALSTVGMLWAFGFGALTMFPIAMAGLAALFALIARGGKS